ncbi:MAG: magnetosome biogenesis CDF transporter MamB [Gammaproteobacteria bacterium]|nr:magnetosome biogenesis CDF transporter MamB [Gammaproteobacteria bacterium]
MKFDECKACRDEVVWWAFFVNVAQTTYKGLLGFMTGSAALIADAMHSGADVAASLVTIFSLRLSSRPADEKYPYGYGNIQYISSSIVGLILIFGALYLIYESAMKIFMGEIGTPNPVALLGAAISALTNEIMFRYQNCVGTENKSPAIIANAWDNRSDAISSLAVLVGILLAVVGFPIMDGIAAIAVGILVIRIGIELNMEALYGLMDTTIELDDLKSVYHIALETPGVHGISMLRGRNVGEDVQIEMEVYIDKNLKVFEGELIADAISDKIKEEEAHVVDVFIGLSPIDIEKK